METHTAFLTLISMAVLVGLGVGYLAKTAMFKSGPTERVQLDIPLFYSDKFSIFQHFYN